MTTSETRTMFVTQVTDPFVFLVDFSNGDYAVSLDLGIMAEYADVVLRYRALMNKLGALHQQARQARE